MSEMLMPTTNTANKAANTVLGGENYRSNTEGPATRKLRGGSRILSADSRKPIEFIKEGPEGLDDVAILIRVTSPTDPNALAGLGRRSNGEYVTVQNSSEGAVFGPLTASEHSPSALQGTVDVGGYDVVVGHNAYNNELLVKPAQITANEGGVSALDVMVGN